MNNEFFDRIFKFLDQKNVYMYEPDKFINKNIKLKPFNKLLFLKKRKTRKK
jgi:hypothetical protein